MHTVGSKTIKAMKRETEMIGENSGSSKSFLYWLTLSVMFVGFIAVLLS